MKKMEARDLKANCDKVIEDIIANCEPVLITIKGEPIVRIDRNNEDSVVVSSLVRKRKKKK
jgi:antitoxin (DNA-binding transcriptional repressor) of toxin-antitoxin stability system